MYPHIMVPPTTLRLESVPPYGSREHAQMAYDNDSGFVFVNHDFVHANTAKAAAAMYLGVPLIEVVCIHDLTHNHT